MKYWTELNSEEYKSCVLSFLFPMLYKAFGEKGMKYVGISINSLSDDIEDEKLLSSPYFRYYESDEDPYVAAKRLYEELYPQYSATGQAM